MKFPGRTAAAVEEYKEKGAVATAQGYLDYWAPIIVAYAEWLLNYILSWTVVSRLLEALRPVLEILAQQYNTALASMSKSDITLLSNLSQALPRIPAEKIKRSE